MIVGLPIDGTLVSGTVSPAGWRDSVTTAINLQPPDVPTDQKDRKMMGVHSGWLTTHFDTCPMMLRTSWFRGMVGLVFGI
jgi:hypothetical protein